MLSHLSQKACKRLREAGLATRTLTLTIRYAGFETHTRSKTLGEPTRLDGDIFAVFQELFRMQPRSAQKSPAAWRKPQRAHARQRATGSARSGAPRKTGKAHQRRGPASRSLRIQQSAIRPAHSCMMSRDHNGGDS